jgi:hypothetical protein
VEVKGGSMKIVLSKKLHAPVVKIGDSTVTIWHYLARRSLMDEISKNFVLSNKDTVIVDIGAGEGETAIFFYLHGYRNFVLIEKEPNKNIYLNAMALTNLGCSVTVLLQPFSLAMFDKIPGYENRYFKLDCEGCEKEFLEVYHPFEFSLELHPGAGRISDIIKMYGSRVLDFKEWHHGFYYVHVAPAIIPREPSFVE